MIYILSVVLVVGIVGLLLLPLLLWDKGRRSLVLALRSLWLHKLRSILSVLGIIIGTMAVIMLMAFGEGSMQDALDDIKRQGATNIIVRSVKPPDTGATQRRNFIAEYGLKKEDYERFQTKDVIRRVPIRALPQEVRYLERMTIGRVVGTTPEYSEVHKFDMAVGRFLHDDDEHHMDNTAVLGSAVAENLFPFGNPLGHTVRLGSHFYKVIGVIKDRMPTGGTGGSQAAEEFNNDVYIPLSTMRVRYGESVFIRQSGSFSGERVQLSQVTLTVSDIDKVRPTGEMIRQLLEEYHPRQDYALTVPLDRLEAAEREKARYIALLWLIGSISLLVGGIGIMNIMLATVTERTREIGIRRALGAKRRDITLQFLIEAVAQTTVGGLAGVIMGIAMVYVIPFVWERIAQATLPAKIHVPSIFISIFVSITVGVLFGLYPARRAALFDPIEALRHE